MNLTTGGQGRISNPSFRVLRQKQLLKNEGKIPGVCSRAIARVSDSPKAQSLRSEAVARFTGLPLTYGCKGKAGVTRDKEEA